MIDLHLHTTASDGFLSPEALVTRAHAVGLTVIGLTDHDTVGGLAAGIPAAAEFGIRVVPGIEITAVENDRDVHVLGYFIDAGSASLAEFLRAQRADRLRRARIMAAKLDSLGFTIAIEPLIEEASASNRTIGRPALADALVAIGHVVDRNDAFERLLGRGRPAYVPRLGLSAAHVIRVIHSSGGIASLAHPGILGEDALIPRLTDAGLDAIEVWHSEHSSEQQEHYRQLATRFGLACSGGSDFHGDGHRACQLGTVVLPAEAFVTLEARAARR